MNKRCIAISTYSQNAKILASYLNLEPISWKETEDNLWMFHPAAMFVLCITSDQTALASFRPGEELLELTGSWVQPEKGLWDLHLVPVNVLVFSIFLLSFDHWIIMTYYTFKGN